MTDFERLCRMRRELEEMRSDLASDLEKRDTPNADLLNMHDRVSKAIKALAGQG